MRTWYVLIAITFGLAGCATHPELAATGGSRADGTVVLSYSYPALLVPKVEPGEGLDLARQRCQAWGYPDASAFGGQKKTCQDGNMYGCQVFNVDLTYQCTGAARPA
ncbi:hypothetical protein A7A08_01673 [Methyloligella halotolerans]|uniref:YecR-like lipoprotein n=1 Tax=Methyloligella halotolerans TaxID=1177755 RepID=A0A1E2RZX9_9HYPH|nr:YecR family lipoprotein [Methyloligella halotolerans]ODA67638.1 hypothetical protein A7A08_01673 [Methyloligella halotolerans]